MDWRVNLTKLKRGNRTGVPRFHEDRPDCRGRVSDSSDLILYGFDKSNPYNEITPVKQGFRQILFQFYR